MGWDKSKVDGPFDWPELFGYHLNIAESAMTAEQWLNARVAEVWPSSPETVWAGDDGVPETLPIYDEEGVKVGSTPNPAESVPYDTVFMLFVDEDEAKAALPHLWSDDE